MGYDLRNRLYNHIQYLPFTYHDHIQTGQLISRCIEDVRSIEKFCRLVHRGTGAFFFLSFGVLFVMFSVNSTLAVISLLPIIPLIIMTSSFGTKISALFFAVDNAIGDVSNRLQENVTGVRWYAHLHAKIMKSNVLTKPIKKYFTWVKVIDEWAKIMPTTNWLTLISTMLILWFGGQMVMDGTMTIGTIVAFNAYILMLAEPAQALTGLVNAGGEAAAGAQRVLEVLDVQPEIQSAEDAVKLETLRGEVEFRDVGLKYQNEKTASLDGIN